MKNFLKPFLFICFALIATFSVGLVEPVSASAHVSEFIQHADWMPALAAVPLLAVVQNNCTIPAEVIADLKAKYGKIKILSVVVEAPIFDNAGKMTDPGEIYYFAVRRPDAGHVRLLMDYAKKGDLDNYVKTFIKNLVVGGDTEKLETDGIVYLGFSTQVDEFLKPYKSFLSNA